MSRWVACCLSWVGFVLALSFGCTESGTIQCANGLTCPSGYVCDEGHERCALPEERSACEAKADLDPCSTAAITDGLCEAGTCFGAGCGNSIKEADELCDDGNILHGDGCSADCRSNEQCGNGHIDAALGESCDDGNTTNGDGCQATCKTSSCGDGIVDEIFNEECDLGAMNSQLPDAACRANCLHGRCGDDVVDSGEICDDGNQNSNDGCRFDCLSNETCGNGILDVSKLEVCDDGNTLNHDGCGVCQPETISWRRLEVTPPARTRHALAYDAARGRIVLFGGSSNLGFLNDNWEWTGTGWIKITPVGVSPPVRVGHAMAYDSKRRVVVLFGGLSESNASFDDTWEWNGAVWKNVTPTDTPAGRYGHSMAYDAVRGKVVLFGGAPGFGATAIAETWTWDGTTWTNVTPASASNRPSARFQTPIAFDPKRGRIVLFGGNLGGGGGGTRVGETWEWNGTVWNQIAVTSPPENRDEHGLAFDPSTGRVVMYGGYGGSNNSILNETWEWTGTAWIAAAAGPAARSGPAMAYDVARGALVMFGGQNANILNATFTRVADTWTERIPQTPLARTEHAMTYDENRARLVMFGGRAGQKSQETWEWVDQAWINVTPAPEDPMPSPRWGHALAYDTARKRVVLFGGRDDSGVRDDTWEWDGTTWTDVTPTTTNPGPREFHAMAYDKANARVVMFGGKIFFAQYDAWTFDGTAWTPLSPAAAVPGPRFGHALVYNAVSRRLLLFGGDDGSIVYGDTWELDGSSGTWTEIATPASNPGPRRYHGMSYDAYRSRTVLYGGFTGANVLSNDTWEWNGVRWNRVIDTQPGFRYITALAFDAVSGQTVMFGGASTTGTLDQTWMLRERNADREESCHLGLDGDADTLLACSDDDCYAYCTPGCNPALRTCGTSGARCGDGVCSSIESKRLCPGDCGVVTARCGDYVCDVPETATSCPGDCTL